MGRFLNPGNETFSEVIHSEIYVDKTQLLEYTNKVISTTSKFICSSRPRRFGKSITAEMLSAYYSKGCDSRELFADYAICKAASFEKHLNQYDVIHFDVQWCMMDAGNADQVVEYINNGILQELKEKYGELIPDTVKTAYGAMSYIKAASGNKFVVIIDEWDVLIRDEAQNHKVQEEYIDFLRGMFKGSEPSKYIALAYLTGILPIKKLKTQSALNNFEEFTMLDAGRMAPYVGFTEEEVHDLCDRYGQNYEQVKSWYDGYSLEGYQVYNPKAVVSLMLNGKYKSYWSNTGSYEAIVPLINMDFDGLRAAIIEMMSGAAVDVDVTSFQNDTVSFANRDDVLTYLIHLGYLAYDQDREQVFIPNEEIRHELNNAVKRNQWNEMITFQKKSADLLEATLDMDEKAVADGIEQIHQEYSSVIQYNDENSLSSVLTIAYLSSMQYYFKPVRELPTGRGFADFVYLPKPEYRTGYPALLVELKWNKGANTAIEQIQDKKYPDSILEYTGDILLVGINYNKKTKEHECRIEKIKK
ncbi:AAA family ATPase [Fusicatenibacter sp.]